MHKAFVAFYDRWVLSHPLITLLLVACLVAGLATQLGNLKLDASADSLVLEGDEDLEFFRENTARYGAEEFLIITWRPPGDLLADASLNTLRQMRDELAGVEGVSSVTTILDVPLLQSPPVSLSDVGADAGLPTLSDPGIDRELVRREFRDSPIYAQLLVSPDGRTAAVQVNLARDDRYAALLNRREHLRALALRGELAAADRPALREAERAFKVYSAVAGERQSGLVAQVRSIVDSYRDRASLFVGGVPMIAADMVSFVRSDLTTFGAGILAFMIVVLAVIFRRLRWVVLPIATCLVVATFMLGLLATLDWRMTVISSNFVALLLIVSLAIAIHLMVRYRELQRDNPQVGQRQLVLDTVGYMVVPCLYTSLTTAVAFVSLVVSGLRPVIDFGWMMTTGIGAALVLTFLVFPSLLVLLPKNKPMASNRRHVGLTTWFARFTAANGRAILVTALLLLAGAAFGISRLQVENRFIDYFHESTEIYQGMELLDAELGGTIPLDIVIDFNEEWTAPTVFAPNPVEAGESDGALPGAQWADTDADFGEEDSWSDDEFAEEADDFAVEGDNFEQSYWFTRRGMNRLQEIHNYIDELPQTGKVLSLATTYALVKQLLGDDVGDVELALVQKSLPDSVRNFLIDPYFDEELQQVRISLRVRETSHDLRRNEFLFELRQHLVEEMGLAEDKLRFTNMLVLYNNVLQSLFQSQILTLGAVFIAIMVMFLVLFRSLSLALIAIAPNLLAAGIVLGGMGLAGIPLDIMTITIAAIVVGIGVDHAIHYVHRFKREFPRDRDYPATMYRCHESIGRALYYTSITVIAGFSILALSNFTPSIYFGLLTGLAMFASVIGSLLLLPQLILSFKPLGPGHTR